MMKRAIHFSHVSKNFGGFAALNDVSFEVPAGQSVALWGSNGAGKTTLIRCLLGVTSFRGDIGVEGLSSARQGKEVRTRIGYVPQVMPLFDPPVGEMVQLISRLRGVEPTEGLRLLERFELSQTMGKPVKSLSGGMRQRLALTLALLGNPHILVLDEPTANLDANSQKDLLALLHQLKDEGRTIVFTSHRWSEVRSLADTVVHLEEGRVREIGAVSSLAVQQDHVFLRLEIDESEVSYANLALTAAGFLPYSGEKSVQVTVADAHKMDIFSTLTAADIRVRNFTLEVEE